MITKQQALEFIYDIANSFSISMDLTKGIDCYVNVYSDSCGTFGVEGDFNSLEEAMTEFIKRFGNTALLEDLECLIPVDVNMLEVGQTYKVYIQKDWKHGCFTADFTADFTAKFLGFDEKDGDIVKFENNKSCTKSDFKEIYKVNEHANM